jgi:uncharacterized protein (TIGR03435 family)
MVKHPTLANDSSLLTIYKKVSKGEFMKVFAVCLLTAGMLFGQSEKKKLTFEVVSIKPNNSGDTRRMIGPLTGRFSASNASLRQLIVTAYVPNAGPLSSPEITGLPGWATTDGYDVQAQPEAGFTPTKEQAMEMLQSMLEDRFKLKIRRQPKDTAIYALVVDKGGVKMPMTRATPPGRINFGFGQLSASALTAASLVPILTQAAGRKVVDKTGLTGLYDMELKWTPDQSLLPPGTEIDTTGPSLFTALQEQLGLRLVPETGQVDMFVVESVQKPTEN